MARDFLETLADQGRPNYASLSYVVHLDGQGNRRVRKYEYGFGLLEFSDSNGVVSNTHHVERLANEATSFTVGQLFSMGLGTMIAPNQISSIECSDAMEDVQEG